MGQTNYRWMVVDRDGESMIIQSTLEDLPNRIDWVATDIVAIIQLEMV